MLVERGRIIRELDSSAVRGGAIADLVGLGNSRLAPPAGRGESPARERSAAPRFAKQRRGPSAGERRAGAGLGAERTTRRAIAKIRTCRAGHRHIIRGSHVHRQTAHARTDARHRRFVALEHVARRSRRIPGGAGRHLPGLRSGQRAARLSAAGALPTHTRLPARRQRKPAQCLGGEDRSARRRARTAVGQARRPQGQYLPRRRADDERRLDTRRLRARHRCDPRYPHPRRRRHHRRQGALRIFLPVRRQPHLGARARCTIRTNTATRPAAPRRAAGRWSAPARSRWRSAATRAARSACRRPIPAATA